MTVSFALGLGIVAPPAHSFALDPAEYYGSRLLIATLGFGIVAVLYSMLRYGGRTHRPAAWVVLVVSVCVLPSVSVLFGTVLVFERAERIEFCGSCHAAMNPYVADMQNATSPSLAAVHYRNRYIPRDQCYVCHTSFGLFGTMQAKIAGVQDVRKYYLGSFQGPIRMREPYQNDECLKCHGDAVRWTSAHSRVRDDALGGRTRCMDCHGKDHPAHVLQP
jgi:nitrate/TMAO reductase-like tetraheme cytochrome c subunit